MDHIAYLKFMVQTNLCRAGVDDENWFSVLKPETCRVQML